MENGILQGLDFFSKNPRYITNEAKEKLTQLTAELGDISGIVIDINSKQFIGGNQRSDILDLRGNIENVHWVKEYDTPTKQGTLKVGFFTDSRTGEEFNVRLVDWTPEQCDIANLAANYVGGETDFEKLSKNFNPETILSAFSRSEIEKLPTDIQSSIFLGELLGHLNEEGMNSLPTDTDPTMMGFDKHKEHQIVLSFTEGEYIEVIAAFSQIGGTKERIVYDLLVVNS